MSNMDPLALRAAFGNFMTGVTIVTAMTKDGIPVGFTANSFTSVSMVPPLLLVCPGNHLSSIGVFRGCEHFAINILGDDQEEVSNLFAGSGDERFSDINWKKDQFGSPIIEGCLTTFSCVTHSRMDAGDHLVLIGEVKSYSNSNGLGLGYWKGGYFSLRREREANASPGDSEPIIAGAIVEYGESIFVIKNKNKLRLPTMNLPNEEKAQSGIKAYLAENGISADIGRVYSVYYDPKSRDHFIYFRANCIKFEITDSGEFVSNQVAAESQWESEAEGVMVRRYLQERDNRQFGLYVGDAISGEIYNDSKGSE